MQEATVYKTIASVDIVTDRETVTHDEEARSPASTKGIIYHPASDEELFLNLELGFLN